MTRPANTPPAGDSPIAGTVLPIQRAEELLASLPGVVSVRIVAAPGGAVDEIHLLTTDEVPPKQTVRNVESALIAHLGMRVSHKKISVAQSSEGRRISGEMRVEALAAAEPAAPAAPVSPRRRIYFEDIEVRRSRSRGVACRVTLVKGEESFSGEAEGLETERLRIELAARAAVQALAQALAQAEGPERTFALEGCKLVEAFDRTFVFVGVVTREGRESLFLTGTAEVRESAETASVLAVLDATNRWVGFGG